MNIPKVFKTVTTSKIAPELPPNQVHDRRRRHGGRRRRRR